MTNLGSQGDWDSAYSRTPRLFGDQPTQGLASFLKDDIYNHVALDLGCGDGRDTMFLLRKGFEVTAVDSSSVAVAKLRLLADSQALGHRLATHTGAVEGLELETAKYDLIVATTLLDHLAPETIYTVTRSMIRAVRQGGILFIEVHTVDDPAVRGEGPISEFSPHIGHYFERNELLRLFFPDCRVCFYSERIEWDYDHGEPHQHGFATIICERR